MVWWRARMASGKEMTVLCVNQMNWRLETLLLALPQGGREKDSIGIRNWLRAVWKGRSAARLICPSWLLAMGKPDCSGPQGSQHSVRSCDSSKRGGRGQLWDTLSFGCFVIPSLEGARQWWIMIILWFVKEGEEVSVQVWRCRKIHVGPKVVLAGGHQATMPAQGSTGKFGAKSQEQVSMQVLFKWAGCGLWGWIRGLLRTAGPLGDVRSVQSLAA